MKEMVTKLRDGRVLGKKFRNQVADLLEEIDRLLSEADAALDWVVKERRECHWPTGEMLANVRAATDRHRLRSLPSPSVHLKEERE